MLLLVSGTENLVLPVGTLAEQRRSGVVFTAIVDFAFFDHRVVESGIFTEVHDVEPLGLPGGGYHAVV